MREQPFTGQAGYASLPPRTPISPPEEPLLQLTLPGVLAATRVTEPAHWVGCGLGAPSSSTHPASPEPGSSPTGPSAVPRSGDPSPASWGEAAALVSQKGPLLRQRPEAHARRSRLCGACCGEEKLNHFVFLF